MEILKLTSKKTGDMVYAPNSLIGEQKLKTIRQYNSYLFKYCHIQHVFRADNFWAYVDPYHIYTPGEYGKVLYSTPHKPKVDVSAETPVEKPKPRSKEPIQGDWVQLLLDGEPCEDFTFVLRMIADHDDHYTILDYREVELKVVSLPERDHGQRKAFRMIP